MALTLAKLRLAVQNKVGLSDDAAGIEEVEIDRWANEAVREVLLRTRCYVVSTTLTPGQSDYADIPSTYLDIVAIVNGDNVPLRRMTFDEWLEMKRANVSVASDVSRHYAYEGGRIYLYPGSTAALTVYYVPKPTEMSSGTHDPSNTTYGGIPETLHKALEYYVLWQAGDFADDVSSQFGETYRQQFEREIVNDRKRNRRRGGQRAPRAKLGQYPWLSSRNDTYPA